MSTAASTSSNAADATVDADGSVRLLTLQSEDGQLFTVEEPIATQSLTIKCMVEDDCASKTIPVFNVTGRILAKVIKWWKKHETDAFSDEKKLQEWETRFVAVGTDRSRLDDLYDLIMAANYLNIPALMERCCSEVAAEIRGKSTQQIRDFFNIKSDFEEGVEEKIRKENQWAFE